MHTEGDRVDAGEAGGTKKCPSCAETIRAEALICRFCRHDFRTGQLASLPGTQEAAPRPPPAIPQAGPLIVKARTNGYAIASLVLGILWVYWIGSILALVFGYKAKTEIDASGGAQTGRGMAIAGIVLGWIWIGLTVLGILGAVIACSVGSGCA